MNVATDYWFMVVSGEDVPEDFMHASIQYYIEHSMEIMNIDVEQNFTKTPYSNWTNASRD